MKEWILNTVEPMYSKIKNRIKTLDGRAPKKDKDYRQIKPGDKILIQLVDENYKELKEVKPLEFTVKNVYTFKTIEEACEKLDVQKLIPGAKSLNEIVELYYNFPDYKDRIKDYGFVVIELEK